MTETRILSHDQVFLRMTARIAGKIPGIAVIWDADSVTEDEFLSAVSRRGNGIPEEYSKIIAVSFDAGILRSAENKYPGIIPVGRPFHISVFDALHQPRGDSGENEKKESAPENGGSRPPPPLKFDSENMTVQLASGEKPASVQLTAKEFSLLYFLYLNKGKTVRRDEIIPYLENAAKKNLQPEPEPRKSKHESGNIIEVYIHYLRKKLGKKMIVSVRGKGYLLDV